jgi:hypothetical protein
MVFNTEGRFLTGGHRGAQRIFAKSYLHTPVRFMTRQGHWFFRGRWYNGCHVKKATFSIPLSSFMPASSDDIVRL